MAVEAKYLICEGAHEALEELDNMNLSSTKSKENNMRYSYSCKFFLKESFSFWYDYKAIMCHGSLHQAFNNNGLLHKTS